MKSKKRFTAGIAIALGATLLMTTALADSIIGSGYTAFKDAVKTTSAAAAAGIDNFEFSAHITFKADDTTYFEASRVVKYDKANNKYSNEFRSFEFGDVSEYYNYNDNSKHISKSHNDDKYYVTNYTGNYENESSFGWKDPFEEDEFADIERIIDACVGNLAELVQVEDYKDGKRFTGSLNEAQIPPVINAVSAYILKYRVASNYRYSYNRYSETNDMPLPYSNITIQSASGQAIQNEDGIIEKLVADFKATADDENGVSHTYTADVTFELKGIGSTVVSEPNLANAEVAYREYGYVGRVNYINDKYIGLYKSDIIEESYDSIKKIGEKHFEIYTVDDSEITGRFYELDGDGNNIHEQDIKTYTSDDDSYGRGHLFNYTDKDGEEKTGMLHLNGRNISISFGVELHPKGGYSSEEWIDYMRVFE